MNNAQHGWRIFIEFADREYGDQRATIVNVAAWGITVTLEKPFTQEWFYPWTSILAIRMEDHYPERNA